MTPAPRATRGVLQGRRAMLAAAGIVAALVGGLIAAPGLWPPASAETDADAGDVVTVTVQRTDLAEQESYAGTVGFGAAAPLAGRAPGTLTRLPAPGDVVQPGEVLYRVDDRPVFLFAGDTPFFRTLTTAGPELHGSDVRVLAENLVALGYDVGPAVTAEVAGAGLAAPAETVASGGMVYTRELSAAVRRWQADAGLDATGEFDAGSAVVAAGAVRVDALLARVGADAVGDLMTVTSTRRSVLVSARAGSLRGAAVGAEVGIEPVGGAPITGEVARIDQGEPEGADGTPPVNLTITTADTAALDAVGAAGVRVTFTSQTRAGVLAVPVEALLALRGGGYGLETADGRLIAVTTGLFTGGLVEVSGRGVMDGLEVVSAS